ncbi:thioredoxin family protein [Staphylococcus chromogenes]|uniref:thioredoxin family protein n=1 Tax=Staphylococcus chromogenes TaxID=46126 RepID=UPI0039E01872
MKYELKSVAELENWLEEHPLAVVHIYRENCSVCHAVLPQLEALIDHYPGVDIGMISADTIPEIAGALSIFTVPVDLIFYESHEVHRQGRFIRFDEFEKQLSRIYESIHS